MATYKKTSSQDQEVFINFQGADLRKSFVRNLEMALTRDGINVYVDQDDELSGVDPRNLFVKRIEEALIALAIFSSKYTESSWCLDELVKIKECVEEGKLVAIPIFYKMNPSEVKGLEGDFGFNLWNQVKHTSDFDKLKKWKEALDFVSHKAGLILTENRDENDFITSIVEEVKRVTWISKELTEDELSKQDKDAFMDNETDAVLWDVESDANQEEAERIQGHEAKMYSNSRIDDGPTRNDISLGEANFDATPNLQNGADQSKHGKANPSSTMASYEKDTSPHQVFISFRGEDVGFSFVSHLVSALLREGINVFIDKDERKGKDIGEIFKKMEDSKIAVVVFSSRYSESTWCLEELVKIKEFMDQGKLKVIPISYKVEPLQVKQLNGGFGNKLWNLWRLHRHHHIIKWKEALESVASLEAMMRFWLKEDGSEGVFVTSIVEEVKKALTKISLQQGQNLGTTKFSVGRGEYPETFPNKDQLFGIEQRMEQLEQKLEFDSNETRIIGVVGMPGIGKTTLAMMLHEKWNCKFVRCVPLLEVRKKSKDYGLVWLRTTLLKVLLGGEIPIINDETIHESVKNELLQTKVFLVLDDVSNKKQFEFLLGDLKWVKKGSKIVITTCDKSLLEGLAHDTYLVPQMHNKEAFQLFSSLALDDQNCCPQKTLVDNAGGNPLALKLMGIEYGGKDKSHWEHVFIQNVWKHYIDQLNEKQKDVFLDIVCFFKSEDEYFVRSILDSGDPDTTDAVSEVTDLADKFLITISDSRIEMNDLVYRFGKQLGSPGRHKLWKYKDIINKLGKQGKIDTNNVRGIFLDMSKVRKSIAMEPSTFTSMSKLRYLKIYDSYCLRQCKPDCKLNFPHGLEFPLKDVRYLHWVKYPLEELPSDFMPDNLVDLRLPYSKIKRVWEGVKDTPRLKWVDLSHSRKLLNLSGLSKAGNIQRLNLEGCTILDELPSEIQNMKSLVFLNMRGCIRLWSIPEMNLASLKILILSDCSNLKEFQLISKSIEFLHLDGTAINRLPPTIKNLERLVLLNLKNCKLLEYLPNCISEMKDLEELILSGCSKLKNLPDVKDNMKHIKILRLDRTGAQEMPNISSFITRSEDQASVSYLSPNEWPHGVNEVSSLGRLCLSGNDFVSLKDDISKLYNLKWLDVKQCKKLRSIPMLPPRLQFFDAHGCESLEKVSNPLALQVLTENIHATFNFSNCKKLDIDAKDSIISYTRWKSQLVLDALSRYDGGFVLEVLIGTCFPGWKVPAWFSYRASGSMLKQKLPSHWCDNKFTGIALCAVILFSGNHDQKNSLLVKCRCDFKNKNGSHIHFSLTIGGWSEPGNTSHVFIGYISRMDINKHGVGDNEEGCICTEASLEFQVTDGTKEVVGWEVLKCGFSLIYASDEKNFVIPKRVEKPKILSFVGVEVRLKQLEKVLYSTPGETRIIEVVGDPGIGKTTLATVLFEKRGCKFPSNLFFRMSKEHQPKQLRRMFLEELLKHANQTISDETTHEYVKDKLLQNKSFIVLDDVSDKKQLEFLLGNLNWIKKGSKIVITTREMSFLEGFAHETYVVPKLNNKEAFQLFSYHAFDDQICSPTRTFLTLSKTFVDNTEGNPLALKLLGSELCGKDEAHWKHKMQKTHSSNTKIKDVERSFIDQVNQQHKDVFPDTGGFFRSEDEYFVRSLLDSGNLDSTDAISEVKDLDERFLIETSKGQEEMNDLVYTFEKDLGFPGRYMRLNYEDINNKFKKMGKAEANNVRGIILDMSKVTKSIALERITFTNMSNLRYLKICDSCCPRHCKPDCELYFPDGLAFPLEEVRYLHWLKFPLRELPSDFRPENLVALRLPHSKIERVWEGFKETPRLRWVDLSHSTKLLNISALSKAKNLQRLNLEGCTILDELPLEIQHMKSLVYLNLRGCIRLCSLPEMNLISLKILILSDCSNLNEFQLISESIEFLHLDGTSIKGLPSAIKNLQRLVFLNMRNCKMLEFLPNCLCELKFLEELILSGCSMLKNFPYIKQSMRHLQILLFDETGAEEMPKISYFTRSKGQATGDTFLQPYGSFYNSPRSVYRVSLLQRLCLSGNGFVRLQTDIGQLYHLKWLDVKHCKKLRSVPMLPPRIQYFDAHDCESLEKVANPLALPVVTEQIHVTFNFSNCNKLGQDAKDSIISYTRRKSQLVLDALSRYNKGIASEALIGTCFPGWEVPAWFSNRASGSMLTSKLPPHWCDNRFTGIALCAVIQFPGYNDNNILSVKCNGVFKNEDGIHIPFSCTIGGWSQSSNIQRKIESSHVFIGYVRRLDVNKQEERCAFSETSLEFQVTDGTGEVVVGCEVLKCGFNLVYAPEERENICWDAKTTVATENRVVNVPGEARKILDRSRSDSDIQYQSYSYLAEALSCGKLRRDDNVLYQSYNSLNPGKVKNLLGQVTYSGSSRENNVIKDHRYSCLAEAKSYRKLRRDDNVLYQSYNSLDPKRAKNVLGEVTHFGKTRKNHDIKYQPYYGRIPRRQIN